MLSDAIRQMRRELDDSSEGGLYGGSPDEVRELLARMEFWAAEARNMETRLGFYERYEPIIDLSNIVVIGGPR